jgi:hypothetical protein
MTHMWSAAAMPPLLVTQSGRMATALQNAVA